MVKSPPFDPQPENPREWDPNHWTLFLKNAPYETAGILRMQRSGIPGNEIRKSLRLRGTQLMRELQNALDQETEAHRVGRYVHG